MFKIVLVELEKKAIKRIEGSNLGSPTLLLKRAMSWFFQELFAWKHSGHLRERENC